MNLRHIAALVLVGWYLITPPFIDYTNVRVLEKSPPRNEWQIQGSFPTKDECDKALAEYASNPINDPRHRWTTDPIELRKFARDVVAECIATDDPRLKPN